MPNRLTRGGIMSTVQPNFSNWRAVNDWACIQLLHAGGPMGPDNGGFAHLLVEPKVAQRRNGCSSVLTGDHLQTGAVIDHTCFILKHQPVTFRITANVIFER